MEKGKYDKAFRAMKRLRSNEVQAARDMYYAYKLLEVEAGEQEGKNLWKEFFTVKRNRRAAQSSFFVMFMQQYALLHRSNNTTTECESGSAASTSSRIIQPKSSWTPDSTAPTLFSSRSELAL
jgi:hypothetical protein